MPTITYNFNTSGNYVFDAAKIEVTGSVAQLILGNSNLIFNEDFATDAGFVYDNALVEFVSGMMRQKDRSPANSVFATTYAAGFDLDWHKSGSVTATLNGVPTNVGGKMVCTGAQGVYYTKNTATIETHKFKYTPNYTTTPPTNVNLVTSHNGTNNNDRVTLTNSPSGNNFRVFLSNSTGTTLLSTVAVGGAWTPTAGVEYEIELVVDSVAGTVRIFVDGVLHGTATPGAWSRGVSVHNYWIGGSTVVYNVAEGSFDDYIVFDDAQHSSSYTPGYSILSRYGLSHVDLPILTHAQLGGILALVSLATTEAGTPRYTFAAGAGVHQYWNGSAWVATDSTYAQANDVATANTNFPTFAFSGETTFSISVLFEDTNTLSYIDDLTVIHNGNTGYPMDNPTIVPTTSIVQDDLNSLAAAFTATGLNDVRISFDVDGQQKYWSGSAWINSDGTYAQASTIADAQTNIASFATVGTLKPVFHLHSDDGQSTPNIDTATIDYDFYGGAAAGENVATVWGYIYDGNNNPVVGDTVTATPRILGKTNNKQIKKAVLTTTTDATGYWSLALIETATSSDQFSYVFKIDGDTFSKFVPNVLGIAFNSLVDQP